MKKYQVAIIGTNIGAKHYEDFKRLRRDLMFTSYAGLQEKQLIKFYQKILKQKYHLILTMY